MSLITFEHLCKYYPGSAKPAVDDLNLTIEAGEFLTLLGPSGSGKTTTLMLLGGFETASSGRLWFDGHPIEHTPPHKRNMGVVFQSYSLFPHMTVAQNVAFPLQVRGVDTAQALIRAQAALKTVELSEFGHRLPVQLSGGQQQRVALARALVFEPKVVLMDEPLSALDKGLREQMQLEIRRLHQQIGITMVFVTHDQAEAMTLSDRIAVFNEGKIIQIDAPQALYDTPNSLFVANFIGDNNVLPQAFGRPQTLCVRPERIQFQAIEQGLSLPVTVQDIIHQGDHWRVMLSIQGHNTTSQARWCAKLSQREQLNMLQIGQNTTIWFAQTDAKFF